MTKTFSITSSASSFGKKILILNRSKSPNLSNKKIRHYFLENFLVRWKIWKFLLRDWSHRAEIWKICHRESHYEGFIMQNAIKYIYDYIQLHNKKIWEFLSLLSFDYIYLIQIESHGWWISSDCIILKVPHRSDQGPGLDRMSFLTLRY